MSRTSKITIFVAGLWFLVFIAFSARPSSITQLLLGLLTFWLFVLGCASFIRIFTQWRRERWRIVTPFAACLLVLVLAPEARTAARRFTLHRSLPHYESIIRQIESGTIPVTVKWTHISQAEVGSVYRAFAQWSTNGVLTVEFLTGRGFPVKHTGYIYSSSGTIEPSSVADSRWRKRQEMKPLWFWIGD